MYSCSNPQCRKQYSNPNAAATSVVVDGKGEEKEAGHCTCGAPLKDENGKGWKHNNVGPFETPHHPKTGESLTPAEEVVDVEAIPITSGKEQANGGEEKTS